MAKRSRTRLSSQAPSASSSSSSRQPRRRTVRRATEKTFLERYGSWLLGGLVAVGAILILIVAFTGAQPAFACTAELTPGPTEPNPTPRPSPTASPTPTASPSPTVAPSPTSTPAISASPSITLAPTVAPTISPSPTVTPVPTPEPQPTARLGFTTDLGRSHVSRGTPITYAFCPPTSGNHYNDREAPMQAAVYPPTTNQPPGNFVHNLEHGYVVAAYRCPSGVLGQGDCISQQEFDELTAWFNDAPPPPRSTCTTKVLVVRFDDMSTRFALLAWDRAMLTDEFDPAQADTFAQQWMEFPSVPEGGSC